VLKNQNINKSQSYIYQDNILLLNFCGLNRHQQVMKRSSTHCKIPAILRISHKDGGIAVMLTARIW
jgi:hypothetical protein